MPGNWIEDPWIRHDIATGFTPNEGLTPNLMSPGKTVPFYPSKYVKSISLRCFLMKLFFNFSDYASQKTKDGSQVKPWISLSGDDDGKHYILYPDSEDKDNWIYHTELIIDTGTYV